MRPPHLDELWEKDVVVLVGHGVGGANILNVIVVQLDVSGQRESVGRKDVLLVGLIVQLVTLYYET